MLLSVTRWAFKLLIVHYVHINLGLVQNESESFITRTELVLTEADTIEHKNTLCEMYGQMFHTRKGKKKIHLPECKKHRWGTNCTVSPSQVSSVSV